MSSLKIGKNTYDLKTGDKFLDNGSCIQLLTQNKERPDWGKRPNPTMSYSRGIKKIISIPCVKKYPSKNYENCFIWEVI